jgi:hypothetical protein
MRHHRQGDVPVPAVVAPDLVVVETDLVLGRLETFLDSPAAAGDGDERGDRNRAGAVGQEERQFLFLVTGAADQDPMP